MCIEDEPQDRIDFVFYAGTALRPRRAFTYPEMFSMPEAGLRAADWPSDHFAVVVDFDLEVTAA